MFRSFRDEVTGALATALASQGHSTDDLGLEQPPEGMDAVLASSMAFRLAEEGAEPPPTVATSLAGAIDPSDTKYISEVRAQGPYVNFFPGEAYFRDTLRAGVKDSYGRLPDRDVSVVVEHTSANPTGPIHVGRARNPILGDAIANVLDMAGYLVDRHYYVNDAGRQVAVFTWACETFDEADLPPPKRDRPEYTLVRYYRKGNEYLETGEAEEIAQAEAEIEAIMHGLEAGDEDVYERVQAVVDEVLGGMRECLHRLQVDFDEFVRETRFLRDGSTEALVERLKGLDEAVYQDDAWQLDLPEIDKNMVFLRSDGTTLYPTRDVAHHEWKFDNYDRAVTVLGEDHRLQAAQLRKTLALLGTDTDRLDQVFYSWVNLPGGGGMSTRRGTGIDLDDLVDEAVERARGEVEDRLESRQRDDDPTGADIERIAHQVGIGAVRYDIVAKQPTKGLTFRWEEALDFEAQSAPYVQYVHARCCGILEEARRAGISTPDAADIDPDHLATPAERDLLRVIARFPAVIEAAAEDLEPHRVATYTREFAETFNAFYRECPVLDAPEDVRSSRLLLVTAARNTVANALGVLGVQAPVSM